MPKLSDQAILETMELSGRAQQLSRGSAKDRAEATILLQRISTIRETGLSSDEARAQYTNALVKSLNATEAAYEQRFLQFIAHGDAIETRDFLTGTQTISWSDGPAGGYLVPIQFENQIFDAMAQTDPLLSENVCSFEVEKGPKFQPKQISGYDLSGIEAAQIGEDTQQAGGQIPTVAGRLLRANIIYKVSLAASLEAETDIPNLVGKLSRAYGVGFARKLGADSILGDGNTQPQGLYTVAPDSGVTLGSGNYSQAAGHVTHEEIAAVYFQVNRIYRASPKCAWLMPDSVYQAIRNAVDGNSRPLISVKDDKEELMGKPVLISPSLPDILNNANASLAQNGELLFGDLDHFHIRTSRPTIQRTIDSPIFDITKGIVGFIGRMRMDSALFDPSGGSAPPIVRATVART